MPWNTFWLWFVQIALALALISPFIAFFVWLVVGAVTSRLTGHYESRLLADAAAGRMASDD